MYVGKGGFQDALVPEPASRAPFNLLDSELPKAEVQAH